MTAQIDLPYHILSKIYSDLYCRDYLSRHYFIEAASLDNCWPNACLNWFKRFPWVFFLNPCRYVFLCLVIYTPHCSSDEQSVSVSAWKILRMDGAGYCLFSCTFGNIWTCCAWCTIDTHGLVYVYAHRIGLKSSIVHFWRPPLIIISLTIFSMYFFWKNRWCWSSKCRTSAISSKYRAILRQHVQS